jgi:hypothetical protein
MGQEVFVKEALSRGFRDTGLDRLCNGIPYLSYTCIKHHQLVVLVRLVNSGQKGNVICLLFVLEQLI